MMNMASDAWRMAMASHGLPESVPWHGTCRGDGMAFRPRMVV